MEVILIKDMENLGYANDIVTVKPGYANNYLIPQGYAKAATASAKKVLAEKGKLFGTVTATDLAEALAAKGIELDRKLIAVEGIKTVGEYEATAKLHKEVKAVIKFSVTAAE